MLWSAPSLSSRCVYDQTARRDLVENVWKADLKNEIVKGI